MGTTQTTQQTGQYDPGSKALFGQLTSALGPMLTGYMQNPFGNPFFQTQQQMGTRQAQNLGATGTSNITRNMASGGFGSASSPFAAEMLANQGRANTGLQANLGFLNPVQNALALQQWAGGLGAGYRPLQTGQTQTQSTGGLGTWLPQVAGMALGAATGMPGAGGGGFFGGGGAGNMYPAMSVMQPWAGGGMGAFGEGGGSPNFGYTPGASPGGQGAFGGLPAPPPPGP